MAKPPRRRRAHTCTTPATFLLFLLSLLIPGVHASDHFYHYQSCDDPPGHGVLPPSPPRSSDPLPPIPADTALQLQYNATQGTPPDATIRRLARSLGDPLIGGNSITSWSNMSFTLTRLVTAGPRLEVTEGYGGPRRRELVLVPTFPASGSSFFYQYFETLTGVRSGSQYYTVQLKSNQCRFVNGKGSLKVYVQHREHALPSGLSPADTLMVKTHFPYSGFGRPFTQFTRLLLITRSPVDLMLAHWARLHSVLPEPLPATIDTGGLLFSRALAEITRFTNGWTKVSNRMAAAGVPVMKVRYEDLCLRPGAVVPAILKFLGMNPRQGIDSLQDPVLPRCNGHVGNRLSMVDARAFKKIVEQFVEYAKGAGYTGLLEEQAKMIVSRP